MPLWHNLLLIPLYLFLDRCVSPTAAALMVQRSSTYWIRNKLRLFLLPEWLETIFEPFFLDGIVIKGYNDTDLACIQDFFQ